MRAKTNVPIDKFIEHLDVSTLKFGGIIVGTLPINIVADLQERGVRYFHLSLELPSHLRGKELSAVEMEEGNARIEEFKIVRVQPGEREF